MSRGYSAAPLRRGGALVMLSGVVSVWLALRVALWEPPFIPSSMAALPLADAPMIESQAASPAQAAGAREPVFIPLPRAPDPVLPPWNPAPLPLRIVAPVAPQPVAYTEDLHGRSAHDRNAHDRYAQGQNVLGRSPLARRGFAGASSLVAHVMLLQAGYRADASSSQRRTSAGNLAQANGALRPDYAPQAAEEMRRPASLPRWSMDAWALWRRDDTSPLLSGRPSYGRSQAGAVVRYHLAPSSGHAPQLHLRASSALEGRQERELALGASVRPVPAIPVRIAAEARVSETDRGTEPRAAAYAVTELPPVGLPGGLTGEVYVQGGYVTGDLATPFVDGQARITRRLAGSDDFRLEAGGGAWGGAQEDARRLDVGPSASVAFRVGPARGRVSADYRFRVAGDAQPSSGPALTLSAGF